MTELTEFHHQLIADIQGDADVLALIVAEAFFEKATDILAEAGEIDEANRAYFEDKYLNHLLQVDGYGGDPAENSNILSLIICDFELGDDVRVINKSHINRLQNRLYNFLSASVKFNFRERLEEASVGYGLADLISARWKSIEKIKLIVVTNASFSAQL